jgi:hypothetical protein
MRLSKSQIDPAQRNLFEWVEGEAMNRKERLKSVPRNDKASIDKKLDEALKESFPASDPVSLGHSEHVGQPKSARKNRIKLPTKSARLKK